MNDILNNGFWEFQWYGNRIIDLLIFSSIFLLAVLFRRFFSKALARLVFRLIKSKNQQTPAQTFLNLLARPLEYFILLIFLFYAFSFLSIPDNFRVLFVDKQTLLESLVIIYKLALIYAFTFISIRLVDFFSIGVIESSIGTEVNLGKQVFPFLRELLKIGIIVFAFFFVLGFVFKVNVANLIAGLGIGGLAVALAGKESLENLFASFTIFLDKPFVVGDYITINNINGVVEKVGFRSTRLRTDETSLLILPNKMLVDNMLNNLQERSFRRLDYRISFTYTTSKENLDLFCTSLKETVNAYSFTNSETQVRFFEFSESGIVVRFLCFVEPVEYNLFLEYREKINLLILDTAVACKCDFAFPSRTIYSVQG